mgnify:CR=1 FL=1
MAETCSAIVIGGQSYPVARPADLNAQLVAMTGCTAAEIADSLGDFTLAAHLARAVLPFLASQAPSMPELALAFAGDMARDRAGTLAMVKALLTAPPEQHQEGVKA